MLDKLRSKDFKDAAKGVAKILELFPDARGNDNLLVAYYWKHIQGVSISDEHIDRIKKCQSTETITRCRRKYQEEGRFMPSDRVVMGRKNKEERIYNLFKH